MLPLGLMTARSPSHDLATIQSLVEAGQYRMRDEVGYTALALGFDTNDIKDCILQLRADEFYKTMESEKRPGLMQDVYRVAYLGVNLYVKLQLLGDKAIVLSFKRDESR
jgi:motility quorum-sensing regulator / GCU-specific mRNA interferase toxin